MIDLLPNRRARKTELKIVATSKFEKVIRTPSAIQRFWIFSGLVVSIHANDSKQEKRDTKHVRVPRIIFFVLGWKIAHTCGITM